MTPFLERAAREGVGRAVLISASVIEPGTTGLGIVHDQLGDLFDGWAVVVHGQLHR